MLLVRVSRGDRAGYERDSSGAKDKLDVTGRQGGKPTAELFVLHIWSFAAAV